MSFAQAAIGLLLTLFALAALAGGLAAFLRASQKATLETYKEDNEALRGRVKTLEDERAQQRIEMDEVKAKVSKLIERNAVLEEIVPGTVAIEHLAGVLKGYHEREMGTLRALGAALADVGRQEARRSE